MTIAAEPSSDAHDADMEARANEEFDAVSAFEALLEDAPARKRKEPSEAEVEAPEADVETPSSDAEPDEQETEEGTEEAAEEEQDEKSDADPDDAEVTIKVDGEERKVALKDLKRLYGQEAALTRKSMETAEARKAADEQRTRADVALTTMLDKAKARLAPYEQVDWTYAAAHYDKGTYEQLRKDAMEAYSDVKFLNEELDGRIKANQEAQSQAMRQAAQEAVKVLSDPQTGIPNWSEETYNGIVSYAVSQGIPEAAAKSVTNPTVLKAFWKAARYDEAQAKKPAVKAVATATAKRVLKPNQGSTGRRDDALARYRKSGAEDDAVAAFASLLG